MRKRRHEEAEEEERKVDSRWKIETGEKRNEKIKKEASDKMKHEEK
jgi:hypothetical protein